MILNGVCVIWRGWIDLQRLDGMGYLEYDDERAQVRRSVSFFLSLAFVMKLNSFAVRRKTQRKKLHIDDGAVLLLVLKVMPHHLLLRPRYQL